MLAVGDEKVTVMDSWLQYWSITFEALNRSSVAAVPQLYVTSVEIEE